MFLNQIYNKSNNYFFKKADKYVKATKIKIKFIISQPSSYYLLK